MKPTTIFGWSVAQPGRKSHVVGSADVVVGTRGAEIARVVFSLCGTASGSNVQREPNGYPCARCLDIAFKLAERNELPDMELPKVRA